MAPIVEVSDVDTFVVIISLSITQEKVSDSIGTP